MAPSPRPRPFRVVIGVTGHRRVEQGALADAVKAALHRIVERGAKTRHTPVALTALSALAEGADRIIAEAVLSLPGGRLDVVLPLPAEEYLADFATEESRRGLRALLARARSVRVVGATGGREERYAAAGRAVVDRCDVLLALWDGEAARGPGGTAATVAYARKTGCPLVWLRPGVNGFQVTEERMDGLAAGSPDGAEE